MKQVAKILERLLRWAFILLCFVAFKCVGQNCCEFNLIRRDTILSDDGIFVIEPKPGYQAEIKFTRIPVLKIYDNLDPIIKYAGTWYNGNTNASGFSNSTIAYSYFIGNNVVFQFTGRRVEWIGEFRVGHGRAGVSIDGSPQEIINCGVGASIGVVKAFDLTPGLHTLTITVLDSKPIVVDGFRVLD